MQKSYKRKKEEIDWCLNVGTKLSVLHFQVKLDKVWDNPECKKFENTIQNLTSFTWYRWKIPLNQ